MVVGGGWWWLVVVVGGWWLALVVVVGGGLTGGVDRVTGTPAGFGAVPSAPPLMISMASSLVRVIGSIRHDAGRRES